MRDPADEPARHTIFELIDRPGRLTGVRLVQEIGLPGPLEFVRIRGVWRLAVELPDVHRMEYLFEIRDSHGSPTTIPDPDNQTRAPGAFGEKSVLELADYRPPRWLTREPVDSIESALQLESTELDAAIEVSLWAPADLKPDYRAPLLIVHDGPEYARLGGLTHYLGAAIASGQLPPLRAALVDPGDRNVWYSASLAYARALDDLVFPALDEAARSSVRIGVGASLGGLAMLHAHRNFPNRLAGLFLQSGSFFTPKLDPQESGFPGFRAVTEFVAAVHGADDDAHPVPVVLTCGTVEENLANNEQMAATLRRLGYPTRMVTVRDAHNYTAWRDALDPHLSALVADVVCAHAA